MPNYQQSKIYKIISPHTDKIYIGSTIKQYLSQRLVKHKSDFKRWQQGKTHKVSSFDLIELGNVEIILLELYPCNSKDELTSRERYWYDLNKELSINKIRPWVTSDETLETRKERYINNKEYYKKQTNDNRENYKQRYNELSSMEYKCICGSSMKRYEKSRHIKSDKHQTYLMIQTL